MRKAVAVLLSTIGCLSEGDVLSLGDGAAPAPGQPLWLEPATGELVLPSGQRPVHRVRAFVGQGPGARDVTDQALWSVDRGDVLRVEGPGLFAAGPRLGGHVVLTARLGAGLANARLTVKLTAVHLDPRATLAPDPAQRFGGRRDPARAPQLVYPLDGALLPPNLGTLEVHFRRGPATNTLFELAFANEVTDVRVYTRCQPLRDGCLLRIDEPAFADLAETNRGRDTLEMGVRGTDDQGSAVGASGRVSLGFARDDLEGTLYYWSAKKVYRAPRSLLPPARPELVFSEDPAGQGRCLGCHAVSRDGSKLLVAVGDGASPVLFDLRRKTATATGRGAVETSFLDWNPDASAFVAVPGMARHRGPKNLIIADGTSAAKIGEIQLGGLRGNQPDWSADGTRIAFASVDTSLTFQDKWPLQGGIAFVEWERDRWSAPRIVVPREPDRNRTMPSIAPTNDLVVYGESICPPGMPADVRCDGSQDPAARLWAARLAPGAPPLDLGPLNRAGPTDAGVPVASWGARWNWKRYRATDQREIVWITFSSTRRMGLRAQPPGDGAPGARVWMAAMDPARVLTSPEGVSAPFAVPFQDLATSNQMPQWTTE